MEPLLCPVLGTGFGRVKATREIIIKEIVRSFLAANQAGKLTEKLTIVISPRDFQKSQINIERLGHFLDDVCADGPDHGSTRSERLLAQPLREHSEESEMDAARTLN
jgi:hypothetical protein